MEPIGHVPALQIDAMAVNRTVESQTARMINKSWPDAVCFDDGAAAAAPPLADHPGLENDIAFLASLNSESGKGDLHYVEKQVMEGLSLYPDLHHVVGWSRLVIL
jgi:hypothetical protein